ncbi:MAG TPA: lipocalin family protein [Prolixibacteraceae bacterium]|jgi:hypothetical protein
MKTGYRFLILILSLLVFYSCKKEGFEESTVVGLWKQVSVTEEGEPMTLTPGQESCELLLEANGTARYFHQSFINYNHGAGPTQFYGTWSLLDGKWINLSTEKWQFIPTLTSDSGKVVLTYKKDANGKITGIDTLASVQKQWSQFHIQSRFTILQLSANEMEIRLKTFEGEKKYAFLFAPAPADFIELKTVAAGKANYIPKLVTDQNYWTIRKEFQTLKTYIFKFRKESY